MNKAIRKKFDKVWKKWNQNIGTPDYNSMARFVTQEINAARRNEFLGMKFKNTQSSVNWQVELNRRYESRFDEIHKYLNWIMDSSTMYDNDKLKMA